MFRNHNQPIQPADAWLPFEPTREQPFGRRQAAHLYRRAGFAANTQELAAAVKLGPQATVQQLIHADQANAPFAAQMRKFAQTVLATNNPLALSAWWLHRMLHTPAPLLEKTTLFWHGHFATSAAKVTQSPLMYRQNELLRQHALGKFEAMVQGIARDPAMLLYLDSATNRKTHPNENFAREVMELFCLGLGHYTEKDIQELARAFTGWEIQHGEFKFNTFQHDIASKTILGRSGNFDGDDGIRILLEQPAAAEFICTKLYRFFIADEAEVSSALIAPLAKQFRESGLTIAPVLETMLTSRLFYSEAALAKKIRSPVELSIGLLRSLEGTTSLPQVATEIRELGQLPFYPPNVKGWNGGLAWINSSSLLGRANMVKRVLENNKTRFDGKTLEHYIAEHAPAKDGDLLDWLSDLLLAVPLANNVCEPLLAQLNASGSNREANLRNLLHLLAALPEFQLS